jgi:excisionase family DNA binding protein
MNNPFEVIEARLSSIENLILDLKHQPKTVQSRNESEQPLTIEETAKFLSLSVPTVYGLIHKGKLVGMKPAKRRYFYKGELLNYLNRSRKKTCDEISIENDNFLANSKKRKS